MHHLCTYLLSNEIPRVQKAVKVSQRSFMGDDDAIFMLHFVPTQIAQGTIKTILQLKKNPWGLNSDFQFQVHP